MFFIPLTIHIMSVVISLAVLIIAICTRRSPKSLYFTLYVLSIFVFSLCALFEDLVLPLTTLEWFMVSFSDVLFALFILEHCDIRLKRYQILSVLPLAVAGYLLTLLIEPLNIEIVADFPPASSIPAKIFLYVTLGVLVYHYRRRDKIFKRQALFIITAGFIPGIGGILTFCTGSHYINWYSIFWSISCLFIGFMQFNLGFHRIAIAREQIVEYISDGFITLDMHGRYLDANAAAKRLFPKLQTTSPGMKMKEIDGLAWLSEKAATRKNEFGLPDADGKHRHYQISESEVTSADKVICRCLLISDITEAKQVLDKVSFLAEHDPLTDLLNRRALIHNGRELFTKIAESGGNACMMVMDLDHFKSVNDKYGHTKGDEVLAAVAKILTSHFRTTDLLARYGGEEFCAFLPDVLEPTAIGIAGQLRERIAKLKFVAHDEPFQVTLSVGIAVYKARHHTALEELFEDADAALYAAKNAGRNTVCVAQATGEEGGTIIIEEAKGRLIK
jgi:diguanylate cyclase (GGDEF)-like protein